MKTRKRKSVTTLVIKGKLVEAFTINGFSTYLGRSIDTIRRYEKNDVFPLPPLVHSNGTRYYPVEMAKELLPIMKEFPAKRPPSVDTVQKITAIFNKYKNAFT